MDGIITHGDQCRGLTLGRTGALGTLRGLYEIAITRQMVDTSYPPREMPRVFNILTGPSYITRVSSSSSRI